MEVFVFDVDGTLTPSRLKMNSDFQEFFLKWMVGKTVIFLTGSDKDKTIEQIGERIWKSAYVSMQSCGNQIFREGHEIYRSEWKPDEGLMKFLNGMLNRSEYPLRFGNHIEPRIGLVNFCIPGRDCNQEIREIYYEWDSIQGERLRFAEEIMNEFPEIEASVGGQISIDIHQKGANKSQAKEWILKEFGSCVIIHFFGDKTEIGGNDYDFAKILDEPHKVHKVMDWRHTYHSIKNFI